MDPTEPPARAPPGPEDVLGRRISAALIDLALLLGMFVVLALTIGESKVEGGSVSLSLNGAGAGLYFALVLIYYFALEAAVGQTLGKLLLGLRVVRANGSPPGVVAIAARTVLRIVDWLPLLYLVGFITMMATGSRRQRLGDLAAKTSVVRASPVRHRTFALVPMALLTLLIVALSVYRAGDSGEGKSTSAPSAACKEGCYQGHGVSFNYPSKWQKTAEFAPPTAEVWTLDFSFGTNDLTSVEVWGVGQSQLDFPAANLAAGKAYFKDLLEPIGTHVQADSEKLTIDHRPGLRFQATGGDHVESTLFVTFKGRTQYFFDCAHQERVPHARAAAAEIERGCAEILRTFKVAD